MDIDDYQIRLEALNAARLLAGSGHAPDDQVLSQAREFYSFLKGDEGLKAAGPTNSFFIYPAT